MGRNGGAWVPEIVGTDGKEWKVTAQSPASSLCQSRKKTVRSPFCTKESWDLQVLGTVYEYIRAFVKT